MISITSTEYYVSLLASDTLCYPLRNFFLLVCLLFPNQIIIVIFIDYLLSHSNINNEAYKVCYYKSGDDVQFKKKVEILKSYSSNYRVAV